MFSLTHCPQHETVETQTALVRIFNPASRYKTQASTYRYFGPLLRFDHHQPLTKEEVRKLTLKGKEDPERGITYWGYTLSCCLVELFGDPKIVEFKDYEVAIATLEQPLLLLDIRDQGAMAALGSVADRFVSQAWSRFLLNSLNGGNTKVLASRRPRNGFSRYFYEQIDIYQKVDGILYSNAHNGEKAIALYERSEPIISNAKIQTRPLKDRSIRHLIDAAVAENNMNCFEPYG